MLPLFISFGLFDILDIILVAFLLYQLYMLIRGTVAINIFVGIFVVYILWLIVKAMKMALLSSILGSFMGVGVIAVIIVFQQEIRRFLLLLGTQDIFNNRFPLQRYFAKFFNSNVATTSNDTLKEISRACRNMSKTKTGALIVFTIKSELLTYIQTGDIINSNISHRILESIFFKNSPMHDGAVIIIGETLKAARCVLPIDDDINLPPHLGLRHRAALSMSHATDALIITVSEETGNISYAQNGELTTGVSHEQLYAYMQKQFLTNATV